MGTELNIMVTSMVAAMRSASITAVLTCVVLYIFSITFTQYSQTLEPDENCGGDDGPRCIKDDFGSIGTSFLSLIQIAFFDDAFSFVWALASKNILYLSILFLFIIIEAFIVLNMLIGVICDIVSGATQ